MTNKKMLKTNKGVNYEKHLTEMKVLPEVNNEIIELVEKPIQAPDKKNNVFTQPVVEEVKPVENSEITEKKPKQVDEKSLRVNQKYYSKRDVILGTLNIIAIIGLFVILAKIPLKVNEYKRLRAEWQLLTVSPEVSELQITQNKDKFEKLKSAFLDETEIVNFVNDIESLKSEDTTISKVTFTNETPVADKTNNVGYPLIIEFAGTWENIAEDLKKVDDLPYLFRIVSFNSEKNPLDGMILLKYGGILYVKDSRKN